jgi:cytochrome c-type biogenesis protein CcmH
MRLRALCVALVATGALAFPAGAYACDGWTQSNMQTQLMCIVCHERLDQSNSAFANQVRGHLDDWCAAGWSADRVRTTLIAQFGPEILAAPPKHGFDLLAWLVPAAFLLGGALVVTWLAVVWSRSRRGPPSPGGKGGGPLDPALESRIDADLAGWE